MQGRNHCSHFTDGDSGAADTQHWVSRVVGECGLPAVGAFVVYPSQLRITSASHSPGYGVPVWPKWVWPLCTSAVSCSSPLRHGAVPRPSCLPALTRLSGVPFHGSGQGYSLLRDVDAFRGEVTQRHKAALIPLPSPAPWIGPDTSQIKSSEQNHQRVGVAAKETRKGAWAGTCRLGSWVPCPCSLGLLLAGPLPRSKQPTSEPAPA